jgi:glycosyltransferase involved in cell wall biosynthesis
MKLRAIVVGPLPPNPGGGSISRGQILNGLARAGAAICVIAPISTGTLKEGDWFAARHPDLRIIRYWLPSLAPEVRQPNGQQDVVELERVQVHRLAKELVRSFRPNLLIAGREGHAALTRELAQEQALPWCMLLRGVQTGEIVSGLASEARAALFLDLIRSADLVISVADHLAAGLERIHGITGIPTIPNAVDPDTFRPEPASAKLRAEFGIPDGHAAVLLPGVLVEHKRPLDVLRAAELVIQRHPAVAFLLAGEGPQEDALAAFCRDRGMADHIRFLGPVPYERMPALYNAADIVVMASDSEGLSRVYLEALACGRPLLVSDIPAAREVIEDGQNGFLFLLGDHQALAERLVALLGDNALRQRIGSSARASIGDRSIDRSVDMYKRAFDAFLNGRFC